MSSNHKIMKMRLRKKRKLIKDEINGVSRWRGVELREKMKKYKVRIVGNEKLGQKFNILSSVTGDDMTRRCPVAHLGNEQNLACTIRENE